MSPLPIYKLIVNANAVLELAGACKDGNVMLSGSAPYFKIRIKISFCSIDSVDDACTSRPCISRSLANFLLKAPSRVTLTSGCSARRKKQFLRCSSVHYPSRRLQEYVNPTHGMCKLWPNAKAAMLVLACGLLAFGWLLAFGFWVAGRICAGVANVQTSANKCITHHHHICTTTKPCNHALPHPPPLQQSG